MKLKNQQKHWHQCWCQLEKQLGKQFDSRFNFCVDQFNDRLWSWTERELYEQLYNEFRRERRK